MRATKVKGAVVCPLCNEIIDPEEHELPEAVETWQCPECDVVLEEGWEVVMCSHDPPEVVLEKCPECEQFAGPQEEVKRKQCPSCEEWFDPEEQDFDETEAFRCGECDEVYGDREDAKECCR